jgi:hypothetical protein
MKRAYATAGYLLALTLLATVTAAQTRPDFSGVWKPVESPGSASPPLPLPQPDGPPPPPPPPPPPKTVSTTIVQSATELIIDRRVEIEGRETVYTFVYNLDGTESVNQMGPMVFRTKAAWDGAALVLSSVVYTDDRQLGELRDVYRLETGDLIVETTRQTPAGTFTARGVNRKG